MRLYLLKFKNHDDYDIAIGFVIAAPTAKVARLIASKDCGGEGPKIWISSRRSTCVTLAKESTIRKEGVVLKDYLNG